MDKVILLKGWANVRKYFAPRSAQGYLNKNHLLLATSGCGSSCGSDDGDKIPSSCGSGDENQPKPSACGAGDDAPAKPSTCGSSCGIDGK